MLIQADEESNSMLIYGDEKSRKTILSIVRRLDVKRAQVFFEINILEVNESYGLKFETSQLGLGANVGKDVKVITGWQGGRVVPIVESQLFKESTSSKADSFVKSVGEDLTMGIMSSKGVNVLGIGTLSPSALVSMIKNDSRNKTLMTPYVQATDGEESVLNVGQVVSFLMQETSPSGMVQSVVKKENTGVTLTMIPKVSNNTDIVLNLSIELSAVLGFFEGKANFSKKKIKQEIIVKAGQTIFVSGFTSSDGLRRGRRVPILGDIPILGMLFNNLSSQYSKNSFLIFITPTIIYGDEDLSALYNEKKKQRQTLFKQNLEFK